MDYIRVNRGRLVLDGAFGSTYVVDTVDVIDANLQDLHWHPDHPDIDRLLDARRIVGALRGFVPPREDRSGDRA